MQHIVAEKERQLQALTVGRGKFGEDSSAGGGDADAYGSDPGAAARYPMLPASLRGLT